MSAHFRAATVVRELRSYLEVVRSFTARFADERGANEPEPAETARKGLFRESAFVAARSLSAPTVSR
jgi:hypothetical protein